MKQKNNYRNPIIISGPTPKELRPSPKEIAEQTRLLKLEQRSIEIDWPVGTPAPRWYAG